MTPKLCSTPLLLTATIDPRVSDTPLTVLKDPSIRLQQYKENLRRIIENGKIQNLVLCENTNYNLEKAFVDEVKSAEQKGIQLELISFQGNYPEISKKGKGFGEGEIIAYALKQSKLMSRSSAFYKLSGCLQLSNLNSLINKTQKKENYFARYAIGKPLVDSRFFKSAKTFYQKELIDQHIKTNDEEGLYLERVFFDCLVQKDSLNCLPELPIFKGVSGSTGLQYDEPFAKRLLKKIAFKFGFYKI